MTLRDKLTELEQVAAASMRVASHWRKQITEHGEQKTEAFYQSLHPEAKSIQWEGLTLSRHPTETEKIHVKDISDAQEEAKKRVSKVILAIKAKLVQKAIDAVLKLEPEDYHTLVLELPEAAPLVKVLEGVYEQGYEQVVEEITAEVTVDIAEASVSAEMASLADFLLSRTANSVAGRVADIATEQVILGRTGNDRDAAIRDGAEALSDAPEIRTATGGANRAIGIGRRDAGIAAGDIGGTWTYSALLDSNVCSECLAEDGTEYKSLADAVEVPYAFCLGNFMCRCFIIWTAPGG
jgi:hypothetical protein